MRLRDIPFDRGTLHEYPIIKRDLNTGLIHVSDTSKNAVRTKISVAEARAQSLDNTRFDRDPAPGKVDAYIPQYGDTFKASTDENGVKHYAESTTTERKGFLHNNTQIITESISVAPNGDVKVAETRQDTSKGNFLTSIITKEDTSTLTQSFEFNLFEAKPKA